MQNIDKATINFEAENSLQNFEKTLVSSELSEQTNRFASLLSLSKYFLEKILLTEYSDVFPSQYLLSRLNSGEVRYWFSVSM